MCVNGTKKGEGERNVCESKRVCVCWGGGVDGESSGTMLFVTQSRVCVCVLRSICCVCACPAGICASVYVKCKAKGVENVRVHVCSGCFFFFLGGL